MIYIWQLNWPGKSFYYCGFIPMMGITLIAFHSFVRNLFIIIYYTTSLRWNYDWTTLGHKIIQKKILLNILYLFWKTIIWFLCQAFFVISIHFVIRPISYWKKLFNIFNINIMVKRPLEKLHLYPKWGPDTHISPHQRGAVSKAEQPLFVQKNHFKNY